jgi:hypothetical protein
MTIALRRAQRAIFRAAFLSAPVILLGLLPPGTAGAQTLRGRVMDSETGQRVAGARVTFSRGTAPLTADSSGEFSVALQAGEERVTVQAVGYANRTVVVAIPESGAVDRVFALDFTGDRLPAVAVQARAEQLMPRYAEFEHRRQRGSGAFLRWDEMQKRNFGSVGDALRTVRGVRIQCNQQTFECFAVMVRTPQCQPVWIIDGTQASSFHENTPVRDVYGIEIYRGPGEIPGEYTGSNAACGVIVMWTKSRPFRTEP